MHVCCMCFACMLHKTPKAAVPVVQPTQIDDATLAASTLHRTGKHSKEHYINERVVKADGKAFVEALKLEYVAKMGGTRPYRRADILYDIKTGLLAYCTATCPVADPMELTAAASAEVAPAGLSQCSGCGHTAELLRDHELFGAAFSMCQACVDMYNTGSWATTTEGREVFCRLCGDNSGTEDKLTAAQFEALSQFCDAKADEAAKTIFSCDAAGCSLALCAGCVQFVRLGVH